MEPAEFAEYAEYVSRERILFMSNDMTRGKPLPIIIRLALPMLLGALFQQIYQLTDMYIIGNVINSRALASVGVANTVVFPFTIVVTGLTTGITATISRYFGAKDPVMLRKSLMGAVYITLFCAIIFSVAGIFGAEPMLRLLNTPDDIIRDAVLYLQIVVGGSAGIIIYYAASAILWAVGDSRTPLIFLIVTSILNILLDLLFIWVLGMGVVSAAIALVLSQFTVAIIISVYVYKYFGLSQFAKNDFLSSCQAIWSILKIGLPVAMQNMLLSVGDMVIVRVVNSYGTNVVAAYTTGNRIVLLFMNFISYFTMAHAIYAGQNLGAKEPERLRDGFIKTAGLTVALSALIGLLIYLTGGAWARLFIAETDQHIDAIVSLTQQLLRVHSLFMVVLGMLYLYCNTLRGMGFVGMPFLSGICEMTVKVGLVYILTRLFGHTGLWYIYPIGWMLGLLPPMIWYHLGRWERSMNPLSK